MSASRRELGYHDRQQRVEAVCKVLATHIARNADLSDRPRIDDRDFDKG